MRTPIYQIAIILFGLLLSFSQAFAQEKDSTIYKSDNVKIIITQDGDTIKKRKGLEGLQISIGTNGLNISDPKKNKTHKKLHTGMHFDFGFNNVVDNTNYRNLENSKRNLVINDTGALRMLTKDDLNLNNRIWTKE